jgi:hypothetical protein
MQAAEAPRHWAWRSIPTRSTSRCSGAFSGIGSESVPLDGIIEPWLDRHAEAIAAHARMLWGDGARGLARVWVTGGDGALLGSRLQSLAPHAELVRHARRQHVVGHFRYGQRLPDESGAAPHRVLT